MGCAVNGPGEAGNADFGIAGGRHVGFLYAHGEVLRKVPQAELVDELFREIDAWIAAGKPDRREKVAFGKSEEHGPTVTLIGAPRVTAVAEGVEPAGEAAPVVRGVLARHVAWALLGTAMGLGGWYAWSVAGRLGLFGSIALAFAMWRWLGPRGSWLALVTLGLGMSGVLGWQSVTGARCPAPGTKIFLKEGKPPVSCDEIRASAAAMSMFFGLVGVIGIAAPFYARRPDDGPIAGDTEIG